MMSVGKEKSGFTLIELLVTLLVAGILATLAVPSFISMASRNRLSSDFNEVLSGVLYARSEAVKRRERAVFVITKEGSGGWSYEVWSGVIGSLNDLLASRSAKDEKVFLVGPGGDAVDNFQVGFDFLGRRSACQVDEVDVADCTFGLLLDGYSAETISINRSGRPL